MIVRRVVHIIDSRIARATLEAGIAHICRLCIAEHREAYGDVPFIVAGLHREVA
jgi:hypothetical protein